MSADAVRRWVRGPGLEVAAVLLLVASFLALTPQGRTAYLTASFVTQVVPSPPRA